MFNRSGFMLNLSWQRYISMCHRLVLQIEEQFVSYQYIYAIPRGGLIVGTILSHRLGVPMISKYENVSPCDILVVDDLVDTGKTLKPYDKLGSDIAVLFTKPWAIVRPRYFITTTKMWVRYPYETAEDK